MKLFEKKEAGIAPVDSGSGSEFQQVDPLADSGKTLWQRLWPVMACGAGLFSDGYINNVSDQLKSPQLIC